VCATVPVLISGCYSALSSPSVGLNVGSRANAWNRFCGSAREIHFLTQRIFVVLRFLTFGLGWIKWLR
jgi:hypothetical protein